MFLNTFWLGMLACLTPTLFLLLLISLIIFSQISTTRKQKVFNIISFTILTILFYQITALNIDNTSFLNYTKEKEISFTVILKIFIIIFSIWLISSNKKNQIITTIFRWLGVILVSFLVTIISFSTTGPFLGSLIANQSQNVISIPSIFFGISFGITSFFSIVLLLSSNILQKVKHKNWWQIVVKLMALTYYYFLHPTIHLHLSTITWDDFSKVDMRVGTILTVEIF
jgi:hypothetical protein